MDEPDTKTIRINIDLKKTIDKFIEDFEKTYGISISWPQATKLINNKIKEAGGFIV